MTVEHRGAPSLNEIVLELADDGQGTALRLRHDTGHDDALNNETPEQRIIQVLVDAQHPLSQRQIRQRAATRHTTVGTILDELLQQRRVEHDTEGRYRIVDTATK